MCGICTEHVERHQRAQTQVTLEADSSLLLASATHKQEPAKSIASVTKTTTAARIYRYIGDIIKGSLSAMFTTLYSVTHRSRTYFTYEHSRKSRDAAFLALQRSSVLKGFASTLSCALYRSFSNHKLKYRRH